MSKKSQEKYRLAGLCISCGSNPPRPERQTCEKCAKRCNDCVKKRSQIRIAAGKCSVCGEKALVTKRHCEDCAVKHYASMAKHLLIAKDAAFAAYGGYECACCGEKEKAFLTIDHVYGGGCKHRKEIGSDIYRWLRKNKYPPGFQVLCMNCQWGKKNCNGVCPHQKG